MLGHGEESGQYVFYECHHSSLFKIVIGVHVINGFNREFRVF